MRNNHNRFNVNVGDRIVISDCLRFPDDVVFNVLLERKASSIKRR